MKFLKMAWQKWIGTIVGCIMLLVMTMTVTPALATENDPQWSYEGTANPTHWGDLSTNFALCKTGTQQSPINLIQVTQGDLDTITFGYQATPLVIVNNGHTIQVNYLPGSTVNIAGQTYELRQLHFHTPSEHTIAGKTFPMELHLVHRNAVGELAVVGIMVEQGPANPTIDQIWAHLPATQQTTTVQEITINAADLLPSSQAYFSYVGSLTTPPCSENVRWIVLAEPITFSGEQIAAFATIYPVNARPVQSGNGRMIELHGHL